MHNVFVSCNGVQGHAFLEIMTMGVAYRDTLHWIIPALFRSSSSFSTHVCFNDSV